MMSSMMSNPMMQQMMSNPDMMRQATEMMSGGQPGGFDPANMQSMMNNPSMGSLMQNPEMLKMALNMMKDPNNKEMMNMFGGEKSNVNMGLVVKGLEIFVGLATVYKKMKTAYENKFVKLFLFAFVVLLIAYYFS